MSKSTPKTHNPHSTHTFSSPVVGLKHDGGGAPGPKRPVPPPKPPKKK